MVNMKKRPRYEAESDTKEKTRRKTTSGQRKRAEAKSRTILQPPPARDTPRLEPEESPPREVAFGQGILDSQAPPVKSLPAATKSGTDRTGETPPQGTNGREAASRRAERQRHKKRGRRTRQPEPSAAAPQAKTERKSGEDGPESGTPRSRGVAAGSAKPDRRRTGEPGDSWFSPKSI